MILLFLVVIGLAAGSFVNALVWRLHQQAISTKKSQKKNLSIIHGRSMCPHCRHVLSITDLIPIISWLSLRGRCRYCKKPISKQYPFIELLMVVLFIIAYTFWPYQITDFMSGAVFAAFLGVVVIGVSLAVYDVHWTLLPNKIVYSLAFVVFLGVVLVFIQQGSINSLQSSLWGSLAYGGFFYLIYQFSKGKWIGGGDVRLGFILGFMLGWQKSIIGLTAATYLATLLIITLMLLGRYHKKMRIPFGPFLLIGAFSAVLWGQQLITWYMRLAGLTT